jgi:hypothetical protein
LSRHKRLGGQENASLRRQNPSLIALTFLICGGARPNRSAGALAVSFCEMRGLLPLRQKVYR